MPSTSDLSQTPTKTKYLHEILKDFFPDISTSTLKDIAEKMNWQKLSAGERLFQQGDAGDSFYVLLSGRLKAIVNEGSPDEKVVGEILKGESVGEMSLITGEKRTASIRALRDSLLARLDKQDFEELAAKEPQVLMAASRQVIQRLTHSIHQIAPQKSYSSIAIFPVGEVDGATFAQNLFNAAKNYADVLKLDETLANQEVQTEADHDLGLTNWLSEKESQHEMLLYQSDGSDTEWTRTCLRQADKVLIIANAQDSPQPSTWEEEILHQNPELHCELVLVHPADTAYPTGTAGFFEKRNVSQHYHLREAKHKDFQRLARIITGKANALVLAGGGAKGFAHLGVFKALREANIPVDIVAGTSIGSIMAAGIAMDWAPEEVLAKSRQAFLVEKPLKDYTLPMVSLLYGNKFQQTIKKYFQDIRIEDLWINFFCVSSNFSTSEPVLHQQGPLHKALAASASIPGVLPPIVDGNSLLIDGGAFNNFPVDIMRQLYNCNIIGVDLNAEKEYKLNYDRIPSGWRYMISKFLRLGKRYRIPGIATIMMKATILGSRQKQSEMKKEVDLFMQPPVEGYKMLDMKAFDPLVKTGYEYASEMLKDEEVRSRVSVS